MDLKPPHLVIALRNANNAIIESPKKYTPTSHDFTKVALCKSSMGNEHKNPSQPIDRSQQQSPMGLNDPPLCLSHIGGGNNQE